VIRGKTEAELDGSVRSPLCMMNDALRARCERHRPSEARASRVDSQASPEEEEVR